MSGATLGIVGGGIAAAGALVATTAGGGDDSPSTGTTATPTTTTAAAPAAPAPAPAPAAPTTSTLNGTFSGPSSAAGSAEGITCTINFTNSGTTRLAVTTSSTGAVSGTFDANGTSTQQTTQCQGFPFPNVGGPFVWQAQITGTTASVRAVQDLSQTQTFAGGSFTATGSITLTGSISGGVFTGNIVQASTVDIRVDGFSGVFSRATFTGNFAVTMR